jgi:hypothetical protein
MKGEQEISDGQAGGLPNRIELMPWIDPVVESRGFGPRSMYVEMCWLPVLGPTATWLYRRLGSWAEFNPEGLSVDLVDLSVSLGLGANLGRNAHLTRSVQRLERFHTIRKTTGQLLVRRALAPLSERFVAQLSATGQQLHQEYTRRPQPTAGESGVNSTAESPLHGHATHETIETEHHHERRMP